jgi:hypothetical protein
LVTDNYRKRRSLAEQTQANPSGMRNPDPDKLRAARAWAKAYNSFDMTDVEPLIDENVRYSSMWVFEEMVGGVNYLDYLRAKLVAIRNSGLLVSAEIAETRSYPMYPLREQPCVYVRHQSGDETREAVVLFEVDNGQITQISMTGIPIPSTVYRTGEIPL